ncbi:membrane protein [Planotetraspora silvatica]|uniref:Membrane protein n=1 Tax=Planotetraspora silvatica TaxID=234614 RepID=A0A8J3XKZ1_9ACTN|nr:DMT family transporter [Planotetraspora silvatica]GII44944.1 membrane protein [Planotetraspora silvatica]
MIAVPLALLAAVCNAIASVLQRKAARSVPASEAFRLALMWDLIRRPAWLLGILALIGGFLFQATALGFGGLALVQPLLVVELPVTMLIAAWMFKIRLGRQSWLAVGALTVGLAIFLIAAAPANADRLPGLLGWVISAAVTAGLVTLAVAVGMVAGSGLRGVALGIAAGLSFAYTAVLMKRTIDVLERNPPAVLTTWSLYTMVATGLCSVFLLQNALQRSSLVAVQPALTVTDPVASTGYGVALFGEDIRTGPWVVPELVGIGVILLGSVLLSRSAAILGHDVIRVDDPEEIRRTQR